MILSLPVDAWLLLFVAVGLGLGLQLVFYARRRGGPAEPRRRDPQADPGRPNASDGGAS